MPTRLPRRSGGVTDDVGGEIARRANRLMAAVTSRAPGRPAKTSTDDKLLPLGARQAALRSTTRHARAQPTNEPLSNVAVDW